MTLACTGHRPDKLDNDYTYTSELSLSIMDSMMDIVKAHDPNNLTMISGMALGADMMWAFVAKALNIKLIAAIPFIDQYIKWPGTSRNMYFGLLEYASEVVNTSGARYYSKEFMQGRNEWMVNHCDKLVAVYNGDKFGGTYNCIQYAEDVKRPIIYINIKNGKLDY